MKFFFLIVSCWLALVTSVWAAPAVIGTPAVGNIGEAIGTSLTFAATCPSGNTNVLAFLCVNIRRWGAPAAGITSVTWNGTAMNAGTAIDSGASDASHAAIYTLINPTCDSASHNVVITTTNTHMTVGNMLFLKDVNLSSPLDTAATATGGDANAITVNVTSAATDLVVDCVAARNSNTNLGVGGGQTLQSLNQTTSGTGSTNVEGGQSTEPGAGTVTMSWTVGSTTPSWALVGVSVNPAATTTRRRIAPRHYMQAPFFPLFTHVGRE